jgi:hypothetical protein
MHGQIIAILAASIVHQNATQITKTKTKYTYSYISAIIEG